MIVVTINQLSCDVDKSNLEQFVSVTNFMDECSSFQTLAQIFNERLQPRLY